MSHLIIRDFDPAGLFAGLILPPMFLKRCAETRFKQEWKLTLSQYTAMMHKGPKRQRGSIRLALAATAVTGGAVVVNTRFFAFNNVSGEHSDRVRFKTDGETTEVEDTTEIGGAGGEWWSAEPVTGIGSSHEVRALAAGKVGTWTTSAAADDTWITMNANREWLVTATGPTPKTTSATFEVGKDGVESAEDSATIQCAVTFV